MKLPNVKNAIDHKLKLAGEVKIPENDKLSVVCHEALVFVASKATPVVLTRSEEAQGDEAVLRLLSGGYYVVMPTTPDFTLVDEELHMDEELTYAVINKTCALISREAKNTEKFEIETMRLINSVKANFIKAAKV